MRLLGILLVLFGIFPSQALSEPCKLSVFDVKQKASEQNLDIRLAKLQTDLARESVEPLRAVYDSFLQVDASHQMDKNEPVISIFGTRTDTTSLSTRYRKRFQTGTDFEVGYQTVRQDTNSEFTPFQPVFDSSWFFNLRQPLLRNAFGRSDRLSVEAAELLAQSTENQARYLREQFLFAAIENYWSWVTAINDLELAEESVKRANDFLETTRRLVRYGTTEKSDVYAAQSNVERAQEEVLSLQQQIRNLYLSLLTKLRISLEQTCTPVPTEENALPSLEHLLELGLSQRRDYLALKDQLSADQLRLNAASSSRMPSFDLLTSLSLNEVDDRWGTSAAQAFDTGHTDFFIGGQLSIPLENRTEKSRYNRIRLEKNQTELQINRLEDQIAHEIRETYESLQNIQERIKKSQTILDLERQKLNAANKEYSVGRESSFTIISYEQDLIGSERRLLMLTLQKKILLETIGLVTGGITP